MCLILLILDVISGFPRPLPYNACITKRDLRNAVSDLRYPYILIYDLLSIIILILDITSGFLSTLDIAFYVDFLMCELDRLKNAQKWPEFSVRSKKKKKSKKEKKINY